MKNIPWPLTVALVVAFRLVMAPGAQASLLGTVPVQPGGSAAPGLVASGTSPGTSLASLSATVLSTSGLRTLYSAVYREAGGTLDFYFEVSNLDTSRCGAVGQPPCNAVSRLEDISFLGVTTALGYRLDGGSFGGPFVAGTVAPLSGDRNAVGDLVGFGFSPPDAAKIQPGQVSAVLIISTNATNFTSGAGSIIDGGTTIFGSFAPVAPVPEPASLLLLGAGILTLTGARLSSTRIAGFLSS